MYKSLYALLLLSYLLPAATMAQNGSPLPGSNRVMLRIADTVVYAHLYDQSRTIKPDLDKYYYWYKSQALKITHGSYDGRLLDGEYTEYYLNRQLKTKGYFRKGIKSGQWISWNDRGEYQYLCKWKNGHRNGSFQEYNEAGKLLRCGSYKNDELDGCLTEYAADGKPQLKKYRNGAALPEKEKKKEKQDNSQ